MPDAKPFGSITYSGAKYTLGADAKWTGADPLVTEMLNTMFDPLHIKGASSSVIPPGTDAIRAAAEWAKDPSPELPRFPDAAPGAGEVIH